MFDGDPKHLIWERGALDTNIHRPLKYQSERMHTCGLIRSSAHTSKNEVRDMHSALQHILNVIG